MFNNPFVVVMGFSGSGKTTISKILHQKGIMAFEFSDYFQRTLKLHNCSRQEISNKVEDYIQTIGRKSVIYDIILWIEKGIYPKYDGPIFLIGARHSEDIEILKSSQDVVYCVLVCSSENIRNIRVINRAREIDNKIISLIKNKEMVKVDTELTNCIRNHTNYIIENNSEIENLKKQIDVLLNNLRSYNES